MRDGPLKLQDPDFWGDYRRTESDVRQWMDDQDFRGLLLDVPDTVAIHKRSTLPVLGWFVRSLREDLALDAVRQMLVVAVDLDTKQVRTGLALDRGKTPVPSKMPAGFDPGEGITLNMFDFDLRRALDIPWRASRYRVAVLLADKLSNGGTVRLIDQDYQDPAVDLFLHQWRRDHAPPTSPIWPQITEGPYPSYVRTDESPPVRAEAGITVGVSSEGAGSPRTAGTLLRGSFRLPCLPEELVGEDRSEVAHADASAVIAITLVLTGARVAGPWVFPLRVPAFDAVDLADPSAVVTGYFNIDLAGLPGLPGRPGTYHLYAFSGLHVAGPISLSL